MNRLKFKAAVVNSGAMEADTILKNGSSSKSHTSRENPFLRKACITLVAMTLAGVVHAQDVIVKKNGDEIQAKVEEIGTAEVKYKRFGSESGPTYVISKSELFMIKYADGTREVFEQQAALSLQTNNTSVRTTNPGPLRADKRIVFRDVTMLNRLELKQIMDAEAYGLYRKGDNRFQLSALPLIIGGATIIGSTVLYFNNKNNSLLSVGIVGGGGLIVGSLLMQKSGKKLVRESVDMYNNKLEKTTSMALDFGFTSNGVGVALRF